MNAIRPEAFMARAVNVKVLFVTGLGPIVGDVAASRRFYSESLGIQFKEEGGGS